MPDRARTENADGWSPWTDWRFLFDRTFIRPDEILNVLPDGVVPASIEYINAEGLADYQQIIGRIVSLQNETSLRSKGDPLASRKNSGYELKAQTTSYVLLQSLENFNRRLTAVMIAKYLKQWSLQEASTSVSVWTASWEKFRMPCCPCEILYDVGVNFDEEPLNPYQDTWPRVTSNGFMVFLVIGLIRLKPPTNH